MYHLIAFWAVTFFVFAIIGAPRVMIICQKTIIHAKKRKQDGIPLQKTHRYASYQGLIKEMRFLQTLFSATLVTPLIALILSLIESEPLDTVQISMLLITSILMVLISVFFPGFLKKSLIKDELLPIN